MKSSFAICVLINIQQAESCLQLPSYLLFETVGKLNA